VIVLARHGETQFNVERRAQGARDSPLTPMGVRQAYAMTGLVAELIAREADAPWRLISSPLGRAVATAQIFADRLGLRVELDERIREHSMGEFDGLHADQFVPRFRMDVPPHERPFHTPGGESYEALAGRIGDFLAGVGADDRLIVVSHGAAGRIFRGLYGGLSKAATLALEIPQDAVFRLQNGQIDRFDCGPLD